MIERQVIKKKMKEYTIKEYMANKVGKTGYSHTEISKTPLGERVTIYTSAPGLIVGSKGKTIKELTAVLKRKFGLENPQIEVTEIDRPYLNPSSVAREIVNTFERFGPKRFKFTGYKTLETVMGAGARGAEIVISGRGIPSTRSKTWRFSAGHLKKSGNVAENLIAKGYVTAHLKSGSIGVKVSILHPGVDLPDEISLKKIEKPSLEEVKEDPKDEVKIKKEDLKETKKEETTENKVPTASELEKNK